MVTENTAARIAAEITAEIARRRAELEAELHPLRVYRAALRGRPLAQPVVTLAPAPAPAATSTPALEQILGPRRRGPDKGPRKRRATAGATLRAQTIGTGPTPAEMADRELAHASASAA